MLSYRFKKMFWLKTATEEEVIGEDCPVCGRAMQYPTRSPEPKCADCNAPLVAGLLLKNRDKRIAYHLGQPLADPADYDEDEDYDDDDPVHEYLRAMLGQYTS